tara:strand:+ start:18446 stop:20035 length:1590 start_codon:yes stop_codon:yes gene_type:complete
MAQPGCIDELCLSFDFVAYPYNGPINSYFYESVDNNNANFWGLPTPVIGSFNPFSLGLNILVGNSAVGMTSTTTGLDTSYELFYFQGGNFLSVPLSTPILTPNTYIIRVTSTSEVANDGSQCIYDFSFAINNSYDFIPFVMTGAIGANGWCNAWGCTEVTSPNYIPGANANDGSCVSNTPVDPYGCTDNNACNYDFLKTIDDGSCYYGCYGCTDPNAINWDTSATIACNGLYNFCVNMGVTNCCCNYGSQTYGCIDVMADNYDDLASFDDGSCSYTTQGCTDPRADNYNPIYVTDDGSCDIGGCIDILGSNYNQDATFDNGSCIYDNCKYGCTDPTSSNYDPSATCDDESCMGGCCGKTSSGNFIITGNTESKIDRIKWLGTVIGIDPSGAIQDNRNIAMTDANMTAKYGINEWYPLVRRVPSLGMKNGWTQINQGIMTAYTIDNIHYWDYNVGGTFFAVEMKNCCPGCLYPDIKEEWTMGHVFPPQIENNVFIDRGVASVFEEHYRLTEIKTLEDFDRYQSGFFNIIE